MPKARKVREGDRVLVRNPRYNLDKGPGTVIRKYRKPSWPTSYDILLDTGETLTDQTRLAFRLLPAHMNRPPS